MSLLGRYGRQVTVNGQKGEHHRVKALEVELSTGITTGKGSVAGVSRVVGYRKIFT